jgi:uncharacterized protein
MYLSRIVEQKLTSLQKEYQVIAIYGARQVGKSTLASMVFGQTMNAVSLDSLEERNLANANPALFLEAHPYPLIIDEIQKAPALLSEIKAVVDKEKIHCLKEGKEPALMYVLTCSNQFELQEAVSESLSGRVAVLNIASLSNAEIEKAIGSPFSPDLDVLKEKSKANERLYASRKQIFEKIYKGGMPAYVIEKKERETYFSSYISTYLERDVKKAINAGKERDFTRFLEYMAFRTAQQINYDDIGRNIGVDARTAKSWVSLLLSSGIAITLEPFARNISKRVVQTEKFYFMDTGLASYLCKWMSPEMLEKGAMSGAFYETYAVSEIIKSFMNGGLDFRKFLYYYRDRDQKEVDLIIEKDDSIYPIEIKKGINPVGPSFNFAFLNKYGKKIEKGLVIDSRKDVLPINENNWYCPLHLIGI